MPTIEEIQQYLTGAWRMMLGKPDGIRLLDISADGFWNSFFAIAIALPALIAGWVSIANAFSPSHMMFGARLLLMLQLAVVDIGTWVLPLVAFAVAVRPAGLTDRFAHYVISSNWGSALFAWMMLPPTLLRLFFPATDDVASAISIFLFIVSLVLTWRLTNSALGKGAAIASAVFGAMFGASLLALHLLQLAVGLGSLDSPAG